MLDDKHLFTVTDLKQLSYCGRVVYYEQCLPHIRPRTYKMDAGRDEHEDEQKRATRRNLSKYAVKEGVREFDLALLDEALKLTGKVDEVVTTSAGECFVIDYKLTDEVSANHRLQLAAYSLLLERARQTHIQRGYIYLIPVRKTVEVKINDALRQRLYEGLAQLEAIVSQEIIPAPPTQRNRCISCEFRRFCNDVL